MPHGFGKEGVVEELAKCKNWAKVEFDKDPDLLNRFRTIIYENEEFIQIYGQEFQILIFEEDRETVSGKIVDGKYVTFKVPKDFDKIAIHDAIAGLLSRIFSKYFHKAIWERVKYYNDTYFQETIKALRLKNNQSNWGSCSSERNINLSSRLLFAPREVLDYVIVHELAHLKEMNHSPKYWRIVKKVMPGYMAQERWLKKYGHTLRF